MRLSYQRRTKFVRAGAAGGFASAAFSVSAREGIMSEEIWKAIPGYEGVYEVSSQGRVRSLDRYGWRVHRSGTCFKVWLKGRLLRPGVIDKFGHVSVALGRNNSQCVHTLVALAFIGPRPKGMDVAHKNCVGDDNRADNLKYATRRENNLDASHNDTRKNSQAAVRAVLYSNLTGVEISRRYGVSTSWITAVWQRKIRVEA